MNVILVVSDAVISVNSFTKCTHACVHEAWRWMKMASPAWVHYCLPNTFLYCILCNVHVHGYIHLYISKDNPKPFKFSNTSSR